MASKHLLNRSKKVYIHSGDGKAWWYEEPGGICIIHEIWINGVTYRTDTLRIPWDRVRGALHRYDLPAQEDGK